MSTLSNVGVALQAGDAYRRADLEEQGTLQRLQMGQNAIDQDALARATYQRVLEHLMQEEAAAKTAKKAPAAKPAVALVPVTGQQQSDITNFYADGGMVGPKESRFHGVYDDAAVTAHMPRTLTDYLDDSKQPSFHHGQRAMSAARTILDHAHAMANGGQVKRKTKSLYAYCKECHRVGNSAAVKLKAGGAVRGPGTGTSDSVKAVGPGGAPYRLSTGEYVLSADTVRAVGRDKLDALQAQHHKRV